MRYWVYINDKVEGPYEEDKLAGLDGFTPETLICSEEIEEGGSQEWVKASNIFEFDEAAKTMTRAPLTQEELDTVRGNTSDINTAPPSQTAAPDNSATQILIDKIDYLTREIESLKTKLDAALNAAKAAPGADGLVFLPYMMGERSPVWDAYARGEFFGLSLKTTRREMNRAVLEGCAYGLRQMFDICEELTGEKITHFSSIGGGAKSKVWAQIKADITGRDITVLDMSDMAPVGAALLAGVGAGVFKDVDEASAKVEKAVYTKIKHSDADKEVYDRRYQVYTGLYPRLKDLYRVNLGIKEN